MAEENIQEQPQARKRVSDSMSELRVEKGDKVGMFYGGSFTSIKEIYTVVSVSQKGTITVGTVKGRRYQYRSDGWSKGEASGKIRRLEEGEEETLLVKKEEELAKVRAEREQRDAEKEKEIEKCREWVAKWAVSHPKVETINVTLYIVSLPIPDEPCTLVMRFDERSYERKGYGYSVSICNHCSEGGYSSELGKISYISGGQTTENSAEIDPLEIAAQWMAAWVGVRRLEIKENAASNG